MKSRAQLSLEFLLVATIAISAMALMANSVSSASNRAFSSAELANAKLFSSELKSSIRTLSVLSEGSKLIVRCEPLTEWNLSIEQEKIEISVKDHVISVDSPISLFAESKNFTIRGATCLVLVREKASIKLSLSEC